MLDNETSTNERLINYYTDYYRDTLGLPDYRQRCQQRLFEKQTSMELIGRYRRFIPILCSSPQNQKILVLGAGTGGELMAFAEMGYDVRGIEVNHDAIDIIKQKLYEAGMEKDRIVFSPAESLPFPDGSFDFVWSWSVLEHVQNYEKAIGEAIRVMKPGGFFFFQMPDMRSFWDGHYKLHLPMIAPVWLLDVMVRISGRPGGYFKHGINKINSRRVRNYFKNNGIHAMQLFTPWDSYWQAPGRWGDKVIHFLSSKMGIERDQIWIGTK